MDLVKHATQITSLQSMVDRMKQTARYFIHGHNTCNVERYHRERLKLAPKLFEFPKTWSPRCALNQLLHNDGYAETHRLVLAKLDSIPWSLDIEPGNKYVVAMDRERAYHAVRKSNPLYNSREDQLAREFGKRRAVHDRASANRGHEYQHTPPLYEGDEYGEEVTQRRKTRRSREQIEKEKAEQEAEEQRLKAMFDEGDTTFTTLGVIDVNLPKKKTKNKQENETKKAKKVKLSASTDKENADPSSSTRDVRSSSAAAVFAASPNASASFAQQPVARAIMFR
jgi:hypothetical protein